MFRRLFLMLAASLSRQVYNITNMKFQTIIIPSDLNASDLCKQGELVEATVINNILRSIDYRKSQRFPQEAMTVHGRPGQELSALLPLLKREYDAVILLFRTGAYLEHRGPHFYTFSYCCIWHCVRLTSARGADAQKAKTWREHASKRLLDLNYSSEVDSAEVSRLHLQFGTELRRRMGPMTPPAQLCTDRRPARQLRIG